MENEESGFSRDEIFEQLRKIAEEEERLYGNDGKQMSLDFGSQAETEPIGEVTVGDSQQAIDSQPDVDFDALVDGSEDPIRVSKLWNGAQGLIIANVPKGKQRKFALNEKRLFLKASANTRDSKFTFLNAVQTVFDVVEKWVQSNEDAVELGMALWDLNERSGFHSKKVINTFNASLAALMKVPPPKRDNKDNK